MMKRILFIRLLIVSVFFSLFIDVRASDNNIKEKQEYLRENILNKNYDADEFMSYLKGKKGENGLDLNNWPKVELEGVVKEFIEGKEREMKQQFLNAEISDKGYDRNIFANFLQSKKAGEEGGNDIDNWTMDELKNVVEEFIEQQNHVGNEQENLEGKEQENIKKQENLSEGQGELKNDDVNSTNNLHLNAEILNDHENGSAASQGEDLPMPKSTLQGSFFNFYRYGGKISTSFIWSVVNSYCGLEDVVVNDWYSFRYSMCSGYRLQPNFMASWGWIDMNFNFLEGIAGFLIRYFIYNDRYSIVENIFDFFNVCIDIKVYNNLYFAVNIVGIVRSIVLLFVPDGEVKNHVKAKIE